MGLRLTLGVKGENRGRIISVKCSKWQHVKQLKCRTLRPKKPQSPNITPSRGQWRQDGALSSSHPREAEGLIAHERLFQGRVLNTIATYKGKNLRWGTATHSVLASDLFSGQAAWLSSRPVGKGRESGTDGMRRVGTLWTCPHEGAECCGLCCAGQGCKGCGGLR